jgi:hypothetical protein
VTDHRTILLATGTSGGLSFAALLELLRAVNWVNLLTFLGTVVSTGIALYVSARSAKREQDHLDRQAKMADDIAELAAREKLKTDGRDLCGPAGPDQQSPATG